MHVLVIPSWYPNANKPLSGISFKEQAEALFKQKIHVGVIAINESPLRYVFNNREVSFDFLEQDINGVKTISLLYPIVNRWKNFRKVVRVNIFKQLFKIYIKKHGEPDLVHLHSFIHGESALWLKKNYNIPYVVTEHNSGFARGLFGQKELAFAKKVFENASFNIAVSSEFKKLLEKIFKVKFEYIPNMTDTTFFNIRSKPKNQNEFKFINIAFLDKKKNQNMLIYAFEKAFKDKPDIKLTIVGNGLEYNNLFNLIKELNMEKQISLYGKANRDEVKKLLQNSDIFVLSSKYETFGVAVVEAMACGLPVVSTKCGGPESIIIDDRLGYLSDLNVNDLSNKILEINQNRDKFNSKYIREYIENNFSEKFVVSKLQEIYREIKREATDCNGS
jgi:glycosyltransferase involved in cell wall biosynthesis